MAITRISTDANGVEGNGASGSAVSSQGSSVFSPDGTKVAFISSANNLVDGDTNNQTDIFVRDLTTGAITRVSTAAGGVQATGGASDNPVFSPDGTKIAFSSAATNLVPNGGDTNGVADIFVKDLNTGAITRVSTAAGGGEATGGASINPVFSPDGTKIAFASGATNLVPNGGDTNGFDDIFVKDLNTGAITRVNTTAAGAQATGANSGNPQFSPDGTKIAFTTGAGLVANDTNGSNDLYIKDLSTQAVTRVNTKSDGSQSSSGVTFYRFSPTGNKIAFTSSANDLVSGDTNGVSDIFLKDLSNNTITRINTDASNGQSIGGGITGNYYFSADGTKLAFASNATNLVPNNGDTNNQTDVFLKDLTTNAISRVSVNDAGAQASGGTNGGILPAISPNGNRVVFASTATNLVPSDGNNAQDIFVTCFATGTLIGTTRGDIAVEDLRVGDLAVTASGAQRPIRWIGHRSMDPRRHPRPAEAMPVRIRAGAFGENRPARDLVVSPGHSLCLDIDGEVLIPASALVNGTTVTQETVESVTYWHVELDSHDILIAEGLPAESYLDMGNRGFFVGGGVVSLGATPDTDAASRTHADFCRPFHGEGTVVAEARARLRRRARTLGWRLAGREAWAEVHLEVDGRIVRPVADGLSAGFVLPAGAQEVWLVCPTVTPSAVFDSADERALGLCLSGLSLGGTAVALDDPRLAEGFHAPASGLRWTAGQARLPAELLDGLTGEVSLRLDLFQPPLPRWVEPRAQSDVGSSGTSVARAA